MHYEEAIQALSAAIIRSGNSRETEIQIYELLALSYQALQRNDEAEGAYRLVLARDPGHQLSTDIAPRIIDFFNGVKRRWEAEGRPGVAVQAQTSAPAAVAPVAIEHHSPAEQRQHTPIDLTARVDDPDHRVARLVLAFRQGDHGLFQRVDASGDSSAYRATVPASFVRPPAVEYYFEAVSTQGVPVQARGDAFAPLRVVVPNQAGLPAWPFVVGAGVIVVAAGAIIAGVLLSSQPSTLMIEVHGQ